MLVFIDTNIWYPVVLTDLVLRSVEIGLFDLAWTDESLAEVERILVELKGLTAANAAATRGGRADVPLTSDVADFPAADVAPTCRVLHPADLFGELAGTYPIELERVIAEMAAHRKRPPMTPDDVLDRLDAQGLHVMVDALRRRSDDDHG